MLLTSYKVAKILELYRNLIEFLGKTQKYRDTQNSLSSLIVCVGTVFWLLS